ncbi:MAG: hypothetical protein ABI700_02330 [Chloroflexota bacterium]
MINAQKFDRPKVRGTVILSAFVGVLNLLAGLLALSTLNALGNVSVPIEVGFLTYFPLGLGVLLLIAALLIATYKRLGLRIGLVAYLLYFAEGVYSFLQGARPDLLGLLTIVLAVAAANYLYKYLTGEPEKQFFT